MGINVLPPDINKSGYYFVADDNNSIWFGLGGIKNVGGDLVKLIIKERKENGEYQNLDDFVHRVYEDVGKKAIEYLIMAGTMDSFGDRLDLLKTFPTVYQKEKDDRKASSVGQFDFFSLGQTEEGQNRTIATPLEKDTETDRNVLLQWEKELLGLYFSSHPLDNLQDLFITKNVITLEDALEFKKNNDLLVLGVMINKVRKVTTKR